jgi:hypothetical protein
MDLKAMPGGRFADTAATTAGIASIGTAAAGTAAALGGCCCCWELGRWLGLCCCCC